MATKYNFFVFETSVPMNLVKGAIYITPYGEDYVNIFRSISQYEKTIGDIEETDESRNIFVDRGVYTSSVDFRIKNPTLPRDSIFIQSQEPIPNILIRMKKGDIKPYDFFSGKSTEGLNRSDLNDVQNNIKIVFYVMLQYMTAGYHKGKNIRKIPDWCVCFSEPVMKYFIHYFEIPTEAPDIDVVDQFLTTPQFREMITMQLLKFMANYSVNNKIIDPSDVESWYDAKLWLAVKNKF